MSHGQKDGASHRDVPPHTGNAEVFSAVAGCFVLDAAILSPPASAVARLCRLKKPGSDFLIGLRTQESWPVHPRTCCAASPNQTTHCSLHASIVHAVGNLDDQ